jgi:hypothetical protein
MTTIIDLDAARWERELDFYDALLGALGAPEWHGKNVNAVIDSVICGGINQVMPPFVVRFHGTRRAPDHVLREINFVTEQISRARGERLQSQGQDTSVGFEIID